VAKLKKIQKGKHPSGELHKGETMNVTKALSNEETGILEDINSLITTLLQMNIEAPQEEEMEMSKVERPKDEDDMEKVEHPEDEDEEEMEKMEHPEEDKRLAKKKHPEEEMEKSKHIETEEGTTASDDAEERVEEYETPVNQDSLEEITKALRLLLAGRENSIKENVKKAYNNNSSNAEILNSIKGITQVVAKMQEQQNETNQAVSNILEGIGIADQIEKVYKSQERQKKNKPVIHNPSEQKVLKAIGEAIVNAGGNLNGNHSPNQYQEPKDFDVQKSLKGIMGQVLTK